ncbi:MAG: hypothetical protein CME33_19655 [Gimesia sp.]|nr:hypothetical protein [Gimesia sp.]
MTPDLDSDLLMMLGRNRCIVSIEVNGDKRHQLGFCISDDSFAITGDVVIERLPTGIFLASVRTMKAIRLVIWRTTNAIFADG